jgi:hypothetical protein
MNHQEMYESAFNAKVDAFKDKDFYPALREQADDALSWHTGFGLNQIHASDFIDHLIVMPAAEIEKWANGESPLMWPQSVKDYGIEKAVAETYLRFAQKQGASLSARDSEILEKAC